MHAVEQLHATLDEASGMTTVDVFLKHRPRDPVVIARHHTVFFSYRFCYRGMGFFEEDHYELPN